MFWYNKKQFPFHVGWLKCCFTTTETVGLLGTGAQAVHLDFHTAPELWIHWYLYIFRRHSLQVPACDYKQGNLFYYADPHGKHI